MRSPNFFRLSGRFALIQLQLLFVLQTAFAGSATWNPNPTSGDWNTAINWTPPTVPDGPVDVATFGISNQTSVVVNENVELDQLVFDAGANAFTITSAARPTPFAHLIMTGAGIINNSGINQTFVTQVVEGVLGVGVIEFHNSATAGSSITYINSGETFFEDTSTAGDATFINEGGSDLEPSGGSTDFFSSASAGHGTFINHGGTGMGRSGGSMLFAEGSTADQATFVCNGGEVSGGGGAFMYFSNSFTTAGNATFTINGGLAPDALGSTLFSLGSAGNAAFTINGGTASGADGGSVSFATDAASTANFTVNGAAVSDAGAGVLGFSQAADLENSVLVANDGAAGGEGGKIFIGERVNAGSAQFKLFGNGSLDISGHDAPGVTIGSLEGDGVVFLGKRNLSIGGNALSTAFSGTIDDANSGNGGSLTKLGSGTLKLTGDNSYRGGTFVQEGSLIVNNRSGSATGTGAVQLNAGTIGGRGTIAGPVTAGTESGTGAFIAPSFGAKKPAILTIQSALTFKADATYTYKLNTKRARADTTIANGVTIESGAQFNFVAVADDKLTAGTIFTAISNTAATSIAGTFANLPDDSTFVVGNNAYQVDYQGGDGNDLTLTVVP